MGNDQHEHSCRIEHRNNHRDTRPRQPTNSGPNLMDTQAAGDPHGAHSRPPSYGAAHGTRGFWRSPWCTRGQYAAHHRPGRRRHARGRPARPRLVAARGGSPPRSHRRHDRSPGEGAAGTEHHRRRGHHRRVRCRTRAPRCSGQPRSKTRAGRTPASHLSASEAADAHPTACAPSTDVDVSRCPRPIEAPPSKRNTAHLVALTHETVPVTPTHGTVPIPQAPTSRRSTSLPKSRRGATTPHARRSSSSAGGLRRVNRDRDDRDRPEPGRATSGAGDVAGRHPQRRGESDTGSFAAPHWTA